MASFAEADAIMAPASPPVKHLKDATGSTEEDADFKAAMTLIAVMIVAVIMACIMLVGSLRKRTSSGSFKKILWITVLTTPLLISYALGQMTRTPFNSDFIEFALIPIWGLLLLAWLGSYGTISAFQLVDNETALVAYYQGVLKCGLVFILVLFSWLISLTYQGLVLLILTPFMFPRVSKRARAMAYASKNNLLDGVGKRVEIVADFMEWDVTKNGNQEHEVAPENMVGYRYLVGLKNLWKKKKYKRKPPSYLRDFDMEKKDIVTTQDIWQCKGELLTSKDSDGRLKDTCLSFALFWMLLRRYTGHTLPEVTKQNNKTWKFVRKGLIPDISETNCDRTFRVIEQEISLLYDYFYTKNFVTYVHGFWSLIFQFLVMGVYLVFAQLILNENKTSTKVVVSHHLEPFRADVILTKIVIFVMCALELALIVHYLFITPWSKVGWVCTYVRLNRERKSWIGMCQSWVIEKICRVSMGRNIKHWKRELDQYSLLRHHHYVSFTRFFSCCLKIIPFKVFDVSNKGRKSRKAIPFSTDLKKSILSSLHNYDESKLTNGITTLIKFKVETQFSWACALRTHTETILVWHIATKYCLLNYKENAGNAKNTNYFVVAKSLSQYCAYLVAFKPELLPDQINTTFNIFESVIDEANTLFKKCPKMDAKYKKMNEKYKADDQLKDDDEEIMKKGIVLGMSLVKTLSTAESLSNMLGEFWAELLLYLAPSEDFNAHLKQVANGGELITQLWALLTHAGILNRDFAPTTTVISP